MTYEELRREIDTLSISQLPGILQSVVRLCSIKPVFKDKENLMLFVSRSWDLGGVGDAELRGTYLDTVSRNKTATKTKSADSLATGAGIPVAEEGDSI